MIDPSQIHEISKKVSYLGDLARSTETLFLSMKQGKTLCSETAFGYYYLRVGMEVAGVDIPREVVVKLTNIEEIVDSLREHCLELAKELEDLGVNGRLVLQSNAPMVFG